jgi:hypothetical protein
MKFIPGCGCCGLTCPGGCLLPTGDVQLYYDSTDNPAYNLTLPRDTGFPSPRYVAEANFVVSGTSRLCRFVFACSGEPRSETFTILRIDTSTVLLFITRAAELPQWLTITCSPLFYEHIGVSETVQIYV